MIFEIGTHRLLFIHIPKCAGTSIERSLNRLTHKKHSLQNEDLDVNLLWGQYKGQQLQHLSAWQIFGRFGHSPSDFDGIFTVVRDPFSRIMSELRWQFQHPFFQYRASIAAIAEGFAETDKPARFAHYRHQYEFIEGYEADIEVFKISKLDALAAWLGDMLGQKIRFRHDNPAKTQVLPDSALHPATLKALRQAVRPDYTRLPQYFLAQPED